MNAALFIARRLGLRAAGSRSLSPGVIVGYIGISLAVVIMILAICIVSGFKHQITGKLLGFNAEITVYAHEKADNPAHTSGIRITDSLRNIIAEAAPGATTSSNAASRMKVTEPTPASFRRPRHHGSAWVWDKKSLCIFSTDRMSAAGVSS